MFVLSSMRILIFFRLFASKKCFASMSHLISPISTPSMNPSMDPKARLISGDTTG